MHILRKNFVYLILQAPADVQYALELYDRYNLKKEIHIIIFGVRGIYEFINTLQLCLGSLIYVEMGNNGILWNPLLAFKENLRLKKLWKKHFTGIIGAKVIFFTHYFNWVSAYIISRLSIANTILFIDHYDTLVGRAFSRLPAKPKDKVRLFNLAIATGMRFGMVYYAGGSGIEFQVDKYKIKTLPPPIVKEETYVKYAYIPEVENPAILLIETKPRDSVITREKYKKVLGGVLGRLKKCGAKIYLKAHPRAGCSPFLSEYIDGEIPEYIPSEFVSMDSFICVLGITTSGLIRPALYYDLPSVSIIKMIGFPNEFVDRVVTRLSSASKGEIQFVESIAFLENLLIPRGHCQ